MNNKNSRRRVSSLGRLGLGALGAIAITASAPAAFAQDLAGTYPKSGPHEPGQVVESSPHFGVSLLRSFYFRFVNGDHHIKEIKVEPEQPQVGQTELVFRDESGDDPYDYHTPHAPTDSSGMFLGAFNAPSCRGMCTYAINRPGGDFVFVLRGFSFSFNTAFVDHHLQHIGIYEQNGNLTLAFNDGQSSDVDDRYLASVQYAYVPRSRFANLGTVEGWSVSTGQQTLAIPAGTSVLRGFDVAFTSGDHHIDEIGFLQGGSGSVAAFFNDSNNDDLFNWAADWGIMN